MLEEVSAPSPKLIVPSSNTSVGSEFYRLLPPEVTIHTARLLLTEITKANTNG